MGEFLSAIVMLLWMGIIRWALLQPMQDFVHQRYGEQQGRLCRGCCPLFLVGTLVKSRITWREFNIPNMGSLKRFLPQRWLLLIEIQTVAVFSTFRGAGLNFLATGLLALPRWLYSGLSIALDDSFDMDCQSLASQYKWEVTLSSNNCGREECFFSLKSWKERTIPPYWAASVWGKSFLQVFAWLALLLGFGVKNDWLLSLDEQLTYQSLCSYNMDHHDRCLDRRLVQLTKYQKDMVDAKKVMDVGSTSMIKPLHGRTLSLEILLNFCPGPYGYIYIYLLCVYVCIFTYYRDVVELWGHKSIDPIILHSFLVSGFSNWHHAMQKEEHGKNNSTKPQPNFQLYWTLGELAPGNNSTWGYTAYIHTPYQRVYKAMSSSARLGKPVGSANRGERPGYSVISLVGRLGNPQTFWKNWAAWIQVTAKATWNDVK